MTQASLEKLAILEKTLATFGDFPDFKGYITPTRRRAAWDMGLSKLSGHTQFALKSLESAFESLMDSIQTDILTKTKDLGFGISFRNRNGEAKLAFSFSSREDDMTIAINTHDPKDSINDFRRRLDFLNNKLDNSKQWFVRGARGKKGTISFTLPAQTALEAAQMTCALTWPYTDWDCVEDIMPKGTHVRECDESPAVPFDIVENPDITSLMRDLRNACHQAEKSLRHFYYNQDEFEGFLPDLIEAGVYLSHGDPVHSQADKQIESVNFTSLSDLNLGEAYYDVREAQYALAHLLWHALTLPGLDGTSTELSLTMVFLEHDTEIVMEGKMGQSHFNSQGLMLQDFIKEWTVRFSGLAQLPKPENLYAIGFGFSNVALVSGATGGDAKLAKSLLLDYDIFKRLKSSAWRVPKVLELYPNAKEKALEHENT